VTARHGDGLRYGGEPCNTVSDSLG